MTVLGANKTAEKSEDKENLVKAKDVSEILPTRIRLVKARKTRLITKLILSISILFIVLIGIFLSVCYMRKIGPFYQRYHGFCKIAGGRWNHKRPVFESYEITGHYALITVPQFRSRRTSYQAVRTLHLFQARLTIIQHHNACFIKKLDPKHAHQFTRPGWYHKLMNLRSHHQRTVSPHTFRYQHYKIQHPALPHNYLRDRIHHMAAAMCQERPVYRVHFMLHFGQRPRRKDMHHIHRDHPPTKLNGKQCNKINCENKCKFKKHMRGCVKCLCVDNDDDKDQHKDHQNVDKHKESKVTEFQDKSRHVGGIDEYIPTPYFHALNIPPVIVENKAKEVEDFKDKTKPMEVQSQADKPEGLPVYKDEHKPMKVYNKEGNYGKIVINRKKRGAIKKECKVVAQFFEGFTPLDVSSPSVDYIHSC